MLVLTFKCHLFTFSDKFPITTRNFSQFYLMLFFRVLWQHLCRLYNVIHRKSETLKTPSMLSLSIKDLFNSYFVFSLWQMIIRNDIFNTIFIMKTYGLQSDTRENQFIFDGLVPPQGQMIMWVKRKTPKLFSNLCPILFLCKIQVIFFTNLHFITYM